MADVVSLEGLDLPEWKVSRLLRTDPDAVPLLTVEDGVFLPDGGLLLVNLGTSELVRLGPDGTEVRRIGRAGDGPGEFRWPSWLELQGESIAVYDKALRRLTTLGPEFEVTHTRRVDGGDEFIPLAPLTMAGDTLIAVHGVSGHVRSQGEIRDTTPLYRGFGDGTLDTIGLWPGEERAFATVPQGRLVVPIVYGRTLVASGRNGATVISSTDSLAIRRYDRTGRLLWRTGASAPPEEVGSREVEAYRAALVEALPLRTIDTETAWSSGPVRSTVPPLGALLLDSAGRTWIGEASRPGQRRRRWTVLDTDGTPIGRVRLPSQFRAWPNKVELLDVSADRIALLLRTDLDEEFVEVWRIR